MIDLIIADDNIEFLDALKTNKYSIHSTKRTRSNRKMYQIQSERNIIRYTNADN